MATEGTTPQVATPRQRKTHYLKSWALPFHRSVAGQKPWEWRRDDRDFQVGDIVWLCEWNSVAQAYTGRALCASIVFVMRGDEFELPPGYCIFSLTFIGGMADRAMVESGIAFPFVLEPTPLAIYPLPWEKVCMERACGERPAVQPTEDR